MNTQKNVVFLFCVFLVIYLPNKLNAIGPCSFDLDLKGVIDLSSVGRVDGKPAWKDITPERSDDHGNCSY